MADVAALELRIGQPFKDKELAKEAMRDSSVFDALSKDDFRSNDRLALIGDAVIELVVRERMHFDFPRAESGQLTVPRNLITEDKGLAIRAKLLSLPPPDLGGTGVKANDTTVSARYLEAIIGAVYLDAGFAKARELVLAWIAMPTTLGSPASPPGPGIGA